MTTAPTPDPLAFDALLSRSWRLFRANLNVIAPMLIAAGIIIALLLLFAVMVIAVLATSHNPTHPSNGAIMVLVLGYLGFIIAVIVVALWAFIALFGMADAVWERGSATIADGTRAFRTRAGAVLVAYLGFIGLAIAALIIALPTLGLSFLALMIFTMYVFPAAIGGGRGGFEAISESFRLVQRFFVPSLITIIVLLGIQYGISFIGVIPILPLEFAVMPTGSDQVPHFPPIPLLLFGGVGYLVSIALLLAYNGFYAIALVGMYRNLVAQPVTTAPVIPPVAPPEPPATITE